MLSNTSPPEIQSIRSLARVFTASAASSGNDYPMLSFPMGYTGEVGSGSETAYDLGMNTPKKDKDFFEKEKAAKKT